MKSLAKDDPRAQEADPRDDLGSHAGRTVLPGKQAREQHKTGRADRNQRVGAQAGHPLTPLAFESDARAHERGHSEADGGLINRSVHCENPVRLAAAAGPKPDMLRTAPAIAFQIRQFEDRYVKSSLPMQDDRAAQDTARQPNDSNGPAAFAPLRSQLCFLLSAMRAPFRHPPRTVLNRPAPGCAIGAATVRKRDLTGNTDFHRARRPACPPDASSIPDGHCDRSNDTSAPGMESGADPSGGEDPEGCHWNRCYWKA